jgi:mRNA interferase MazF
MVRGEVFRLPVPPAARGHEQRGTRYAVVLQADEFLDLSTTLVAPTSTTARPTSFRPTIDIDGTDTRVLVEQTVVVDPSDSGPQPAVWMAASSAPSTTLSRLFSASDDHHP